MLFQDHEKQIYQPPNSTRKFDPLVIDRALTIAANGKLNDLLADWQAPNDTSGDVNEKPSDKLLIAAKAEEQLVVIARQAFGFEPFPEVLDGVVLETLHHYLGWMEGKGKPG